MCAAAKAPSPGSCGRHVAAGERIPVLAISCGQKENLPSRGSLTRSSAFPRGSYGIEKNLFAIARVLQRQVSPPSVFL